MRGIPPPFESLNLNQSFLYSVLLATWYAIRQIIFWLGAWILPTIFDINAGARTFFDRFKFSGSSLTNLIVVSGLILHFVQVLRKEGIDFIGISKKVWPSVSGPLIFLFSYSFVIAYARGLPKDLGYVFTYHTYYSYIAQLVIAVGLSLLFLKYHNIEKTQAIQRTLQFSRQKLQIQISVTSFPNPY